MKLPNAINAVAKRKKIRDYLLAIDHPEGAGKAEFFTRFGFSRVGWELLAQALIEHAQTNPASSMAESKYGTKYRIDGPMPCPDGRSPSIRVVWIVDTGDDTPRLVTAHPL